MDQQYFVGIGAQKAGTTWLSGYLAHHPEVCFSPIKELHYFDAIYRSDLCGFNNDIFIGRLKLIVNNIRNVSDNEMIDMASLYLRRVKMTTRPAAYIEYFERLLTERCTVFGEITPSYSLLDANGFSAIKNLYPDAKFIFILRNPVDRYWSHLRFHEKKAPDKSKFSAMREFESRLDDPPYYLRTDYKRTLVELYKVVDKENIVICFYENIFNDTSGELKRITDFLGIKYIAPNLNNRVNVSPSIILPDEMRKHAISKFAEVYEYIIENYDNHVPQAWERDFSLLKNK